jgi:hypothetical protein
MANYTANSSQLIYGSKIYEVLQYYYAPAAGANAINSLQNSLYAFIGQVDPWVDEELPDNPKQDQYSIKQVFRNMIATKKVTSADIAAVIPRRDWKSGTIYDVYSDTEDMFTVDENGVLTKNFYIRNRFDQVFKCLWNNNGTESTAEPEFLPGTFDKTFLVKTSDGYKWKFMYTINIGQKQKFLDANWMPVNIGQNIPNPVQTFAAQGDIEVINVTNSGQGYYPGGVKITISGDGQYANGVASVNAGGYITDIVVANTGQGYTYAETVITTETGYPTPNVSATAISPVSPIGGHGFDPISELGCNHVMTALEFSGSEGGLIPTDITYRQLGLVLDPFAKSNVDKNIPYASEMVYDTTTHLFVSSGLGSYSSGQVVYQGPSLAKATFKAKIVSFNPATNILKVINITGTPSLNEVLVQESLSTGQAIIRTLLQVTEPDFIIYSGYMTYIENRKGIERSSDATEQFRVVLRF